MDIVLNPVEVRVLGSMVEKQITTPEYYPLSLNALTNACNQKSNRDPVVSYDEITVQTALDDLREKKLAWVIKKADSRVLRFGHILPEVFHLGEQETAVICALMLRGPLTPGEIRGCTGRLCPFESLAEVESTLERLINNDQGPLAVRLPLEYRRKEVRYAHLLGGEVRIDPDKLAPLAPQAGNLARPTADERFSRLEEDVAALKLEMSELRQAFVDFKKQFE